MARLHASERRALAAARRVLVTGDRTAATLGDYGVAQDRVAVVEPGTDRAPLARGSGSADVHLLCVASVIPRKGHELLIEALASIPETAWHLSCVGSLVRHPDIVERLGARVTAAGLDNRITFAGEMTASELDVWYDRADVFVLATMYEGYGMAVAEALARGLPIVSTQTGDIPRITGNHGASALLVRPGDVDGLAEALSAAIRDADLRARLGAGARHVRERLPTWEDSVATLDRVLEAVARS